MKKTVAAGVLGVAIIAGTGGTFALWQHSDTVPAGNIVTGNLQVVNLNVRPWWHVEGQGNVDSLSEIVFVPGIEAHTHVSGNIELTGLTLNDVQLESPEFGVITLDDDGYIMVANERTRELERTQLQMELGPWAGPDANNNNQFHAVLTVRFVPRAQAGMYNHNANFNLGNITVTVTQNL